MPQLNNLKAERVRNGYTQQKLAKATGISRQTIHHIEKGTFNPSVFLMQKISQKLNCSIEYLIKTHEK